MRVYDPLASENQLTERVTATSLRLALEKRALVDQRRGGRLTCVSRHRDIDGRDQGDRTHGENHDEQQREPERSAVEDPKPAHRSCSRRRGRS